MIAVAPSVRLGATRLAVLLCAGLALAGPAPAFPDAGAVSPTA